jgi:hypothetical protein
LVIGATGAATLTLTLSYMGWIPSSRGHAQHEPPSSAPRTPEPLRHDTAKTAFVEKATPVPSGSNSAPADAAFSPANQNLVVALNGLVTKPAGKLCAFADRVCLLIDKKLKDPALSCDGQALSLTPGTYYYRVSVTIGKHACVLTADGREHLVIEQDLTLPAYVIEVK